MTTKTAKKLVKAPVKKAVKKAAKKAVQKLKVEQVAECPCEPKNECTGFRNVNGRRIALDA